ncbi:MAG: DnaJ domain-containing protein [Eubacterium sp.]|nr:DnaJ domain-containing protein [Eubacterium sp.]
MNNAWYMACRTLGVRTDAGEEEIKKAYKRLVKIYHPDAGKTGDAEHYDAIVKAYDFLCTHQRPKAKPMGKILGSDTGYYKDASYSTFDRRYQRQKQKRKEDLARRTKEVHDKNEREKRQAQQYKNAMDAIRAIRTAELIKTLLTKAEEEHEE